MDSCVPNFGANGSRAEGSPGSMMNRLACGLDLLLWGSSDLNLEDLPPHGSETWQWFISAVPRAMRAPLVADPTTEQAFRALTCRDDDVFVVGYPRCGLSWVHALCFHVLRSDDNGKLPFEPTSVVGGRGPVYHDQPPTRWTHADVSAQARPRLLSSHCAVGRLPATFLASKARLVLIDRDPRDVVVSTFFRLKRLGSKFRALECHDARLKELADACEELTLERTFDDFDSEKRTSLALGMDAGQEDHVSRKRSSTIDVSELDYGDYYNWHARYATLAAALNDRVLWLHYEDLAADPVGAAERVHAFLMDAPPAPEKAVAAARFAAFDQVAARGDDALRKGVVGDHKIYLSQEHWDAVAHQVCRRLGPHEAMGYQAARLVVDTPAALKRVPKSRRKAVKALTQTTRRAPADSWDLPPPEPAAKGWFAR
jgi:hypothetical protein